VSSGVYTVFGVGLPVSGAPVFRKYLFEDFEKLYGGMWDLEPDPLRHAQKMIAHIDKKRSALGIDKARARTLVDMAARRELAAV
jgi:carbon-monoxide dehydrogenase catalytic subunit